MTMWDVWCFMRAREREREDDARRRVERRWRWVTDGARALARGCARERESE